VSLELKLEGNLSPLLKGTYLSNMSLRPFPRRFTPGKGTRVLRFTVMTMDESIVAITDKVYFYVKKP